MQHNAKTILSLVGDKSKFRLAQVYFNSGMPDYRDCKYFKISDSDIICSVISRKNRVGTPIEYIDSVDTGEKIPKTKQDNYFVRLIRELIWKCGVIDYDNFIRG